MTIHGLCVDRRCGILAFLGLVKLPSYSVLTPGLEETDFRSDHPSLSPRLAML
jgi:hypothetical protein